MQIRTTVRFHFNSHWNGYNYNNNNDNTWNNECCWICRETGTFTYCWEKCKMMQPLWIIVYWLLYHPQIPVLTICSKELVIDILKTCTGMFIVALCPQSPKSRNNTNVHQLLEARHKRSHTVWFHLYKISRITKSMETERKLAV